MSYNYTSYFQALANWLVIPIDDANFVAAFPNLIDNVEQRIYTDLDLLATMVRDSSAALTAGNRNFILPSTIGVFVVVEQMNAITPAGTVNPELGARNPLLPASKEMLDVLYPSATGSSVPVYFAPITQTSFIVGPWPLAAYQMEVVGTQRPAPMSASNGTTFLSLYLPQLLFAAGMVEGSGYQKNFSEAGDQPQSAISWEGRYQSLLKSSYTEEMRKKFGSEGWSSKQPDPIATPPRT